MKKNNNSEYFEDWTTKKLIEQARYYDQLINELGGYGKCDIRDFEGITNELLERGIENSRKIRFNY